MLSNVLTKLAMLLTKTHKQCNAGSTIQGGGGVVFRSDYCYFTSPISCLIRPQAPQTLWEFVSLEAYLWTFKILSLFLIVSTTQNPKRR